MRSIIAELMPIAAIGLSAEFVMGLGTYSDLAIEFKAFSFGIKWHFNLSLGSDLFGKHYQCLMER
jgi:hypothetical protein